jgi:citrate lyase synthetase
MEVRRSAGIRRTQCRWVVAGRVLADGGDCSYICGVALLPSHQGIGADKQIFARLVGKSSGHEEIILYAMAGKELSFRKPGFKRMTTAEAIFGNQDQAFGRGYLSGA